jgi:serralysin
MSSVANLSYEFFTGRAPTAAGMDYLVSANGPNPNNLNSAYYQAFSLENRYINFAVDLGKVGEGAANFQSRYGGLSLFDATKQAYATIFGDTPSDAKTHAILDAGVAVGGQWINRADYFAKYGQDGIDGLGTKAAMVGWLLAEADKAQVGVYALANEAFLNDVAAHNAPLGVDLVGVYSQPGFVFHPG